MQPLTLQCGAVAARDQQRHDFFLSGLTCGRNGFRRSRRSRGSGNLRRGRRSGRRRHHRRPALDADPRGPRRIDVQIRHLRRWALLATAARLADTKFVELAADAVGLRRLHARLRDHARATLVGRHTLVAAAHHDNKDDDGEAEDQQRPLQRADGKMLAHASSFASTFSALGSTPLSVSLTASATLTLTSRDTPASCIVTPCRCAASSIVILLCVMIMNCTFCAISRTTSQKRPTLASSSGASTSSIRQNGAGFSWNSASSSATAVIAFSPPDSRWIVLLRLPGGRAITATPVLSRSS